MENEVIGIADVVVISNPAEIARCNSPKGKPFLRVTLGGAQLDITLTLAEMIGGVAKGAKARFNLD